MTHFVSHARSHNRCDRSLRLADTPPACQAAQDTVTAQRLGLCCAKPATAYAAHWPLLPSCILQPSRLYKSCLPLLPDPDPSFSSARFMEATIPSGEP